MRSDNNAIAAASGVAMTLLYLIGGCLVGLVLLLRRRRVIWRQALAWGAFVAFLQLLAGLNDWPLVWLGYDTAVSTGTFATRQLLIQLAAFLGTTMLLGVSFMAAESLTRKAFPHHVQLWRMWRPEVAASPGVLGRTVAAYLMVGVFFAYEVALYLFTTRELGWWTPADHLSNPNVLASYLPGSRRSRSRSRPGSGRGALLFRAVPLAGAALLGQHLGGRRGRTVAIAVAFVVQALIFGAQRRTADEPAWSRVVELMIPLTISAAYLPRPGPAAAMILHFAFKMVFVALHSSPPRHLGEPGDGRAADPGALRGHARRAVATTGLAQTASSNTNAALVRAPGAGRGWRRSSRRGHRC